MRPTVAGRRRRSLAAGVDADATIRGPEPCATSGWRLVHRTVEEVTRRQPRVSCRGLGPGTDGLVGASLRSRVLDRGCRRRPRRIARLPSAARATSRPSSRRATGSHDFAADGPG